MSRKYDFIVFGATGFTGQRVVEDLAEKPIYKDLNVAIAGRNRSKLEQVNSNAGSNFDIVLADVKEQATLVEMCFQAKVLLNCVGPYRFFGEQVVKACIDAGCHYVDISGEPEFIERVEAKYHESAQDKRLIVISACGFDSIPADIGTMFTVAQFPNDAKIGAVESYLSLDGGEKGIAAHYTTYECAVHGFSSQDELKKLRKSMPKVSIPQYGPRPPKSSLPRWFAPVNAYALPFPGSDASIVRRSQKAIVSNEVPVQAVPYSAYFTISSALSTGLFMAFGTVFGTLANFSFGKSLLLNNPKLFSYGIFSHEGPSKEQMGETSFSMKFFAKGYSAGVDPASSKPDINVSTVVSGPEPGYIATPIFLLTSALTILNEESDIPKGVLTTATAFRNTSLISQLKEQGIRFEVVNE